jgi:predicted kinase
VASVVTALVVISGPPNSGKHPLAQRLAAERGLILISRDRLRDATGLRDEAQMTLAMADLARGLLTRGAGVVVCAWNLEEFDRVLWGMVAAETGAELEWLDTRMPEAHALIPPLEGWEPIGFAQT